MLKSGATGNIKALDALSNFFTKKGTVKKRETRYNTGKERFKKAVKDVQQALGSKQGGKKNIEEYNRKQQERRKKAAQKYVEKQAPKTKSGAPDKRFKRQAAEKAAKYNKMVDIFASETYNKLKLEAFGIGSPVVEMLAESGLSADDILKYMEQAAQTFNDIPAEARGLASQDEFWQTVNDIMQIVNDGGGADFADVMQAYITADNTDDFKEVLENYLAFDGPESGHSFTEVYQELQYSLDATNEDTMREILEGDEENG